MSWSHRCGLVSHAGPLSKCGPSTELESTSFPLFTRSVRLQLSAGLVPAALKGFSSAAIVPRYLKFWQSADHKLPVLALYKSLLTHARAFNEPVQTRLRNLIRVRFRGSRGKGLRSVMRAREALEVATLAETQLERARRGDQEIAAALLKEFGKPLIRMAPLDTHERKAPLSSKRPPQASPDLPPRPRKPPYLNYDSQKNPFFRPRVHNQSHAMMMASRLKQTQHRHDRSDSLHYQALLASTEDQFYQALSLPQEVGWHAEVKLARAVLHEQMKQASVRQSELWDILEEEHEDRWRRYREDMEEYKRQRRERFVQRAQQS